MLLFDIAPIEGPKLIRVERHEDARGYLTEIWREDVWRAAGIETAFCQENHSLSLETGTIRGLHMQIGAAAQAKLIRCIRGTIFDVIVDLRRHSPSFGRHASIVLSADGSTQLFVPAGFAHGYCTLEPNTEILYKASAYYDPQAERAIAWNDPELAISWPVPADQAILSPRDRSNPSFGEAIATGLY